MSNTHPRLAWIDHELDKLESHGLRRRFTISTLQPGQRVLVAGQELVHFGSNDYLGLASDPRLTAAVAAALEEDGWGSGASPVVCGRSPRHAELEARLAALEHTEAALLFSSGYAANVGTITALVGREDAIFGDEKNHASIIDGCRLSRAKVEIYPHNDCNALEALLRAESGARRRLIVTDSLFSMDGDLAPLADIADLAQRYDAMLMVDEAHATGVFGSGGGLVDALNLQERVDVRIGTLSKALGSAGGFVAGSQSLVDWLLNRARPYVFSTAHPAACCAAGLAALEIVRTEPERRSTLLAQAVDLRAKLVAQGWNVGTSASQIVPLIIGEPEQTMRLAAALRERGFYIPGIRPPSVPAGESLLRLSLSYGHTPQMLSDLLAALAAFGPNCR